MTNKNVTARIGNNFSEELEQIKEARVESGIDKKRKSTRKLTDLFVKHKDWKKIKADSIKAEQEKFNNEK